MYPLPSPAETAQHSRGRSIGPAHRRRAVRDLCSFRWLPDLGVLVIGSGDELVGACNQQKDRCNAGEDTDGMEFEPRKSRIFQRWAEKCGGGMPRVTVREGPQIYPSRYIRQIPELKMQPASADSGQDSYLVVTRPGFAVHFNISLIGVGCSAPHAQCHRRVFIVIGDEFRCKSKDRE